MVVVTILPHTEDGPNDHREDAPHYKTQDLVKPDQTNLPIIALMNSTFHDFPFFHFVFDLSIFSEKFWSNIFHDPLIKIVYIICFEIAFFLFQITTFANHRSVRILQVQLEKKN